MSMSCSAESTRAWRSVSRSCSFMRSAYAAADDQRDEEHLEVVLEDVERLGDARELQDVRDADEHVDRHRAAEEQLDRRSA